MRVKGLRRGKSAARQTRRVRPVSVDHIAVVLPLVPAMVRGMIEVQCLSGCRPQTLSRCAPRTEFTCNWVVVWTISSVNVLLSFAKRSDKAAW
jgi:hypothetical protein